MPRKSLDELCERDPKTFTESETLFVFRGLLRSLRMPIGRVFHRERPECGAKCRDGHACKAPAVLKHYFIRNGRCRRHGGLSTGARTPEGEAKAAEAVQRRWQQHREAQITAANN